MKVSLGEFYINKISHIYIERRCKEFYENKQTDTIYT